MTALKAHQVDAFLQKPDRGDGFFLVYGPDSGLVRERARILIGRAADGGDHISLDMSEIASAPERLAVEARTPSLFGGRPVIRIRDAAASLVPTLNELLEDWPDVTIVAEAGNLTPRDGLRVLAEKSPLARTLPCYADNERDLDQLIRKSFDDAGISTEPDTVSTLRELLGNDREVTRGEIEKLLLFADQSKKLTTAGVIELCGDNTALALDSIVDATTTGHAARLESALTRAFTAGTDPNRILSAVLLHFSSLRAARAAFSAGGNTADALKAMRPRPHFSRTKSVEQQIRLWPDQGLARVCARLQEATLSLRRTGDLGETMTRRALLAICLSAAQR